jgi:hypothetical protein
MRTPTLLAATLAALAVAPSARAADAAPPLQIAPLAGALLETGGGRDLLEDAPLLGVQVARDVQPYLAIVGTFTWASTRAKQLDGAELDLLQYDLGLRGQHAFAVGSALALRPFLGTGVGARTYRFRDDAYAGETSFVWYVAGGAELGWRALTAGLTARHQLTSPGGSSLGSETGHDVELLASVGLRF